MVDISPEVSVFLHNTALKHGYNYVAMISCVVYDACLLFNQERKHIYGGRTSMRLIYILLRYFTLVVFIFAFYKTQHSRIPARLCYTMDWIIEFIVNVGHILVVKTILVLRLRALFNNNILVSLILAFAMLVDIVGGTFYWIVKGSLVTRFTLDALPVPGCILLSPTKPPLDLFYKSIQTACICRLASTGTELLLTLIGLYRTFSKSPYTISKLIKYKKVTPVLFAFYRDGLLYFIPIFVFSVFGLVGQFSIANDIMSQTDWILWQTLVYVLIGTRLILNLRIAGAKLTDTTLNHQVSSLIFARSGDCDKIEMGQSGLGAKDDREEVTVEYSSSGSSGKR